MENNPKDIVEKYYQRVLHFLSFRPRSEKEILAYLRRKLKDINCIKEIIIRLKNENLINDEEFIDWWLMQRSSFNPKSKKVLRLELLQKGVAKDLIEEKLSKINISEIQSAIRTLIAKKAKLYSRQKLISYLTARGFEYELVKNLVDEWV